MTNHKRCNWSTKTQTYIDYHDNEWGRPVGDDLKHFEFLILEGAQAGLSWLTILNRREGYRKAFAGFDPIKVAQFTEDDVQRLLQDTGIIRNRAKIRGAINNAQRFLEVQKEFGSFNTYIWQFVGGHQIINHWEDGQALPATSSESDALALDMKKRGFKFAGSTIMYAHMQACGLINDHVHDCDFRFQ